MANVSDKSILTAAGKALLAQLNAEEKALVIDKMIFANVPNRPEYPQPDDVVPTDNVVHQAAVEQRGRLSEDSVIYSTTLASNEGPFEFNWTGAYCSEYGVLVTIDHHSLTPKTVDEPGVSGNTLVRSVVLEYKDIAEITNITVDASTWQYNATPRMKKMDDDVAQANIDQNGKDWFIEEGFLVTPQASAFSIKAGAGYVSGNRVALDFDRSIQVPNKPSFIYIDAHREGTPTGEQVTLFNFVVSADEKDDYIDSSTGKDVPHFVCKIAQVLGDGSVSDLRPEGEGRKWTLGTVERGEMTYNGVRSVKDRLAEKLSIKDFADPNVGLVGVGNAEADTVAFEAAALHGGEIRLPPGDYHPLKYFTLRNNHTKFVANGDANLHWKGADIDNYDRGKGIFHYQGSVDVFEAAAVTSNLEYGSDTIEVDDASRFDDLEYVLVVATVSGNNEIGLYPKVKIMAKVMSVSNNTIKIGYRSGYTFYSNEIKLYGAYPVMGGGVEGVNLIDEMEATPSPNTTTPAPTAERERAVSLVSLAVAAKVKCKNLTGEGAKYPLVVGWTVTDCEIDNAEQNNPVWFGPGEGYGVQINAGLRCKVKGMNTLGCRHNTDFTQSAYCSAEDCFDDAAKQIPFITHGLYEHNITWRNCTGASFRPASSGYSFGNFAHSLLVENCNFADVDGWALDITFQNSTIDRFDLIAGEVKFKDTTVYNFIRSDWDARLKNHNSRIGSTLKNTFTIDRDSVISSKSANNLTIKGYNKLYIDGTTKGSNSAILEVFIEDCSNTWLTGHVDDSKYRWIGKASLISVAKTKTYLTLPGGGAIYSTRILESAVDDIVHVFITDNVMYGNAAVSEDPSNQMRPYQFVAFGETANVNLAMKIGGNALHGFAHAAKIINNPDDNYTIVEIMKDKEFLTGGTPETTVDGVL
ncbi:phage tail protein [Vibrio sp. 99K-1]|uniref:phage tail-collar fiber domain-containing protein n=1 Tax=Vibrio sp. 99K-1 TaxID=2607603 RepID=UPI0020A46F7F|nr:phage tail protein [Vibrio sp. 99K-1]